jgi:hypothetical protein
MQSLLYGGSTCNDGSLIYNTIPAQAATQTEDWWIIPEGDSHSLLTLHFPEASNVSSGGTGMEVFLVLQQEPTWNLFFAYIHGAIAALTAHFNFLHFIVGLCKPCRRFQQLEDIEHDRCCSSNAC